ncbi:MAG: nuclear transport factor 2 family protein [Saprospiraceae bacterium]
MISCKEAKPKETEDKMTMAAAPPVQAPIEFADSKYATVIKNCQAAFSRGDIPTYMIPFADNAVYAWSNGDSLSGKQAISEYWTKRRDIHIDSVSYSNQIFLPMKFNQEEIFKASGIWVLNWYQVYAKYKASGKTMTQWVHLDAHFNANDQIDRIIQYIDKAKVNEAMKK